MLKLIQVPDEYEEACMMEGKTRIEKRKILKEIGHAREQKIHLEYMLQQEKDNTDEDFINDLVRTVKGYEESDDFASENLSVSQQDIIVV